MHGLTAAFLSPIFAACRAQEELEEKLEKYSVRRVPLGTDRHHRRYWWGLAGHRPVVWVEDAEVSGSWVPSAGLFQTSLLCFCMAGWLLPDCMLV